MSKKLGNDYWTSIIESKRNPFYVNFKEIWDYRDLIQLLVRRDIVTVYKQTILGIFWFIIPPVFTTFTYVIIFSGIAKISTSGINPIIFYLSGVVLWSFFNDTVQRTSITFRMNADIFSKVYFPRLIAPISSVLSAIIKFLVQFILVVLILGYLKWQGIYDNPLWDRIWLLPVIIIMASILGLGVGILISSLSTKYRDIGYLTQFGMQLLMYATPVIYPLSSIPEKYRFLMLFNPISAMIESFRYVLTGSGLFSWQSLGIAFIISILTFLIGLFAFNSVEKSFVDTI